MTVSLDCQVSKRTVVRAAMRAALAATMLATSVSGAAAVEDCYHPEELRADAEAKLADFLMQAAMVCGDVVHESVQDAWNEFQAVPEIAAGLARADERRAPYYQRLYGGDDWKLRWQQAEFAVTSYAGAVMQERAPGPAGCIKLRHELVTFRDGGWPAYGTAVDRFFATMKPQVQICAE